MKNREKLADLIVQCSMELVMDGENVICDRCGTRPISESCVAIADYLIANGVTIRPKGLWVGEGDGYADGELVYDMWYCSECTHCVDDGTDGPKMLPNFCPNCGADMRGWGNGIQQENS